MRLGEAEDWTVIRQDKADDRFRTGDEVPRHVSTGTDIVVERKRDSEEYNGGYNMENGLENDGDPSSRIFPQLKEGAEILDGEAKSRHHEDES